MYHTPPDLRVRVAVSQIKGAAAQWTQAVEARLKHAGWSEFSKMLMDRFGRGQQELLLRQFFRLKQLGSVSAYVEEFSGLVDHLIAYGHSTDPLYYTTRFIDGLRDDIRSIVLVHRPASLDSACSLALLQEEVGDSARRRDFRRPDTGFPSRTPPRGPLPLPPPPRPDNSPVAAPAEAKSPTDKFSALRAYRRARGLCDRCAEKWKPGHKCSPTVQLHVLQELFELFSMEADDSATPPASLADPDTHEAQLCVVLSQEALSGVEGPRTMRFEGSIQGHDLMILVDSGSSHTFLSQHLAQDLQGVTSMSHPITVRVANGQTLTCDTHIPSAHWFIQNCSFSSTLKILPLSHFDLIIGMDWLESFSPMKVHWKAKWMCIPYEGSTVFLQGITPPVTDELVIQVCSLSPVSQVDAVTSNIHPEVSALLSEFAAVFAPVDGLPPVRSCDHSIPLRPGSQPVYIRPYRFPPALKDEIERLVQDMLDKGILRYKNRIWLGTNTLLQAQVIFALHNSPAGGHSGFPVTYRRLKQLFAWKGMKGDIKQFVSDCIFSG